MIRLSTPTQAIKGSFSISGSKSISNRLLVLRHVLRADFQLENLSDSEDTRLLQRALEQIARGTDPVIDIHHAGTDMRFLTALLSVTPGSWTITGSERMKQRPVGPLLAALRALGADITCVEKEGYPPLRINGKKLPGGCVEIDASISSQFVSALLLIAPAFENGLELILKNTIVSRPYIYMTIALLKECGVRVHQTVHTMSVAPFSGLVGLKSYAVESDWSSASYWYAICALSTNAHIELSNFNRHSLQADAILPKLFELLGVRSEFNRTTLTISSIPRRAQGFRYDLTECPDVAQTLAVTCAGLGLGTHLIGLQTLKIKETDRISALKQELEKAGAVVEVTDSSIRIQPRPPGYPFTPFKVATYNDHRMAMSFAPLALLCGSITIDDEQVVSKSYPGFWTDLECAGFNVNLQPH